MNEFRILSLDSESDKAIKTYSKWEMKGVMPENAEEVA